MNDGTEKITDPQNIAEVFNSFSFHELHMNFKSK